MIQKTKTIAVVLLIAIATIGATVATLGTQQALAGGSQWSGAPVLKCQGNGAKECPIGVSLEPHII